MKHLKIQQKMSIAIAITLLALLAIGVVGYNTMTTMNRKSVALYQDTLLPVIWLEGIRSNNQAESADLVEMMFANDPKRTQALSQDIDSRMQQTNEFLSNFEEKTGHDAFETKTLEEYKNILQQYRTARQTVIDYSQAGSSQDAYAEFVSKVVPLRSQVDTLMNNLIAHKEKSASADNDQNQQSFNHTKRLTFLIFLVSLVICTGFGYLVSRSIQRPTKQMQNLMRRAEQGDLTVRGDYASTDEIGQLTQSFNAMMEGLQWLIGQIRDKALVLASTSEQLTASADQTGRATEQIATSMQEVATSAETQSQSVEDTVQTVEKMSHDVQIIAKRSEEVAATADQAFRISKEGNQAIQQTIHQMMSIHTTVGHAADTIRDLGEQARNIGRIVEVITGIASQTNLLALNAAIEAARAGEHGRGFAVVADEVRKLAEESTRSAKQIESYILNIQHKIETVVQSMEQGTQEVATGIDVVNQAGHSFEQIRHSVQEVTEQIQEVTVLVQQVASGTEQVVKAVDKISEAVGQTASVTQMVSAATEEQLATMQEITATSNSLSNIAMELQNQVAKFQV
jgi:methyl-accepting chemotaxis protein